MYDQTTIVTLTLGCVAVLYLGRRALVTSQRPAPLPPGPPGIPWVGNVIGVDTTAPWKTYAKWARTYGDLVYTQLVGKDIIIINSEKIAMDLFENRSKNYSDRPFLATKELCGLDFNSALLPYGDRWRLHRRFFHQTFRLSAASRFIPLQHRRACHFLRQLLETPEQLDKHVFEYTALVIVKGVYDYEPASSEDEVINLAANATETMVLAASPGFAAVAGAFPLLLRLPSLKRRIEMARTFAQEYLERPFQLFLQRERDSIASPSMLHDALHDVEEKNVSSKELWMKGLKEASGTAFLAASETSNAFLMTFFLLKVLNPAAQERAQAQIDDVVGNDRLPTIDDRPLLPLVDALFWETFRCNPIVPLSVPHAAVEDDIYRGFFIPKGAIILANLWSMAHDESRFPDTHTFKPERFLNDDGSLKPNETEHIAFGFGRRVCVGRHFADTSVWAVITKVLAVFKILKPLDENGVEIPVEEGFTTGLVIHPLPFKFRIVPRTPGMDVERLERLIMASTS